ncbi:MAG: endolytic transglycosylase MltG [Candidatus Margulisbacteria bacterium]|nr:endolytic transglycosylase MltG [Candidatus Margulisiibacteriota bacterium]
MKKIGLLVGVGMLVLLVVVCWAANPFDLSTKNIIIPQGSSVRAVQSIVTNNGVLPRFSAFRLAIKVFGLGNKIKAGEYSLSPSDPLPRVIAKLVIGETVPQQELTVTFPEGASIYKMGMILKGSGYKKWEKFQDLVREGITAGLRERHWGIFKYIPSESLEGYLFPDTYRFFPEASVEVLAEAMLWRYEAVIVPYWEQNKKSTKMTLHEIMTLASIIEKEAQRPAERPVIASVFYNRLKIGMPLAADPTVKYALERPSKVVYLDQLSVKSPYNTYKRRGLPPGPICNPGLASFKAAIYPAKTDYLFFVAKKDGSHAFSKTWQEHQRARALTK